jgi:hypothetical protein
VRECEIPADTANLLSHNQSVLGRVPERPGRTENGAVPQRPSCVR